MPIPEIPAELALLVKRHYDDPIQRDGAYDPIDGIRFPLPDGRIIAIIDPNLLRFHVNKATSTQAWFAKRFYEQVGAYNVGVLVKVMTNKIEIGEQLTQWYSADNNQLGFSFGFPEPKKPNSEGSSS